MLRPQAGITPKVAQLMGSRSAQSLGSSSFRSRRLVPLTGTDLVWNPQFPSWVTVSEVPGLLPAAARMGNLSKRWALRPATGVSPGPVQPTAVRPGAIQPAPRQDARPSTGYDPFLDDGEPADFGGQRSWLRWGMIIGAVVVIGIIVGVYFGVIRGRHWATTTRRRQPP